MTSINVFHSKVDDWAEADLRNCLENLKSRFGQKPRAALYYICVGRVPCMFDKQGG